MEWGNVWDFVVAIWPQVSLVLVPVVATLAVKLGRIGGLLKVLFESFQDGNLDDRERLQIFKEIELVLKGITPFKVKV